jgi:hypothetical protein
MTCKFKSLGLVSAAVLAMSALGASAASAGEFHSANAPATITGTQSVSHVFTTNAGAVTCKSATFSGTQSGKTATEITMTPTYKDCTAFGFINVPIDTNGCAFRFLSNGTTVIECPFGPEIEITVPKCTISIGPQHLASGMSYTTTGSAPNRAITTDTNISGIEYDECGTVRTNGTYSGSTSLKGSAGEIWWA